MHAFGSTASFAARQDLRALRSNQLEPTAPVQAPRAVVIPAAHRFSRPRRRAALLVRIDAREGGFPHGRSRAFRIDADALARLLDAAARMERLA